MAYSFFRSITIDHTKCGSGNSTNFPALFYGTYTYLKTTGNSGDVTNANGYDIIFTSDILGVSLLDFELVNYSATTGAVEFWIRIPTLSSSVDTVIYLFYGNASVTTYQGNTNGTWNSNFKGVWHILTSSALTSPMPDSTSHAASGTLANVSAAAGQIDGGFTHTALAGQPFITVSDTSLPSGSTARSVSVWLNGNGSNFGNGALVYWGTAATHQLQRLYFSDAHTIVANGGGGDDVSFDNGSNFTNNVWYHAAYTYDGTNVRIYLNGASVAGPTAVSWNTVLVGTCWLGGTNPALASFSFTNPGIEDEIHILSAVLSADWILSEYNNQSSPSTFYTISSPTSIGGLFRTSTLTGLGSAGPFFFQNPLG